MKVGVFDSGLGGLTVVKAIAEVLKGSDLFYIADTAFAPYGEKSVTQILNRCDFITQYLIDTRDIDALVVACNTATSAAIVHLRQKFPSLIIVGTEPGIKPALNGTQSSKIGVLATPATLKGTKYQLLVNELSLSQKIELFECACVGLVEQIENGDLSSPQTYNMMNKWLKPMKDAGVDSIVLGCTHYPLVSKVIKDIMGEGINLIETGVAIANRLMSLSQKIKHKNEGDLSIEICHTGKINNQMIEKILDGKKIYIRKCEI